MNQINAGIAICKNAEPAIAFSQKGITSGLVVTKFGNE